MATYNLISSQTLGSSTGSVTFSNIPQTYTDLLLKGSVRTTASGAFSNLGLVLNSNTGGIYSFIRLLGYGTGYSTDRFSGQNAGDLSYANGDTSVANIFSGLDLYIPNYRSSINKIVASSTAQENNVGTTIAYMYNHAQYFQSTAAITSIQITEASGNNLKVGSSFYLYGISNA